MADFQIPYGHGFIPLTLADERLAGMLLPSPDTDSARASEKTLVQSALENPIGSFRLSRLAKGLKKILIITSDHTRPLPSQKTLPLLLSEIRKGSPDADIHILIATGVHRPTTERELRDKFGRTIVDHEKIIVHQAEQQENMVYMGQLPSGGELWLNNQVQWAELVVAEGFIEPHFFAGFSGGRKSILPGIAARKTVLYNHNAQFIANERARQGALDGNPIHRDMCFAAREARLSFVLNVLLGEDKQIVAAVAGHPEEAHQQGCTRCLAMAKVQAAPADIVVVSNGGYPLDQNLYQAVKGMTAAEACVRPGGVIIVCGEMADGHGGEAFYQWFANRDCPQAVAKAIADISPVETQMDQWEAQILARVLCKADCIVVTGKENQAMVEKMHMRWAATTNEAMETAEKKLGKDASVTVIPNGVSLVVEP